MLKRKNSSLLNYKSGVSNKKKRCLFCEKFHNQNLANDLEMGAKGKPFRCQFCNQVFSISCLFLKHMESHLGKSLYRCEFCGILFVDFFDLIVHRKDHLMFACKHCDKMFIDDESRKKHVTRFHAVPKKRNSSSDTLRVSKKKFSLRIDEILQKNTAVLKPFHSCDICYENFPQLSQLLIHKKTHTKEKPHKCNICGKSFKHDNVLKVHRELHQPQQQLATADDDDKRACTVSDQNSSLHCKTVQQQTRMHTKEKPEAFGLKENSNAKMIPVLMATQLGPTGAVLSEHTEPAVQKLSPVTENLMPVHLGAKTVYLLSKPQIQLDSAINICPTSPLLNPQRNSVIQQVRQEKPVVITGQNPPAKILKTSETADSAGFLNNGVSLQKKQQQLRVVTLSDPKNNISVPKVNGKNNNSVVNPLVMENYLILKLPMTKTNSLKIPNYSAIVQSHPCSVASPVVMTPTAETIEMNITDTANLRLNDTINYSKACETELDREADCEKNSNRGPDLGTDAEQQPLSLIKSEPVENTQDKSFVNSIDDIGKEDLTPASVESSSEVAMRSETPVQDGDGNIVKNTPKADVEAKPKIKQERDSSEYEMVVEPDAVTWRCEAVMPSMKQEPAASEVAELAPVEERAKTKDAFVLVVKQEVEKAMSTTPRIPEDGVIDAAANNGQTNVSVADKLSEEEKREKGKDGEKGHKEAEESLCMHCGKNHSKALIEFLAQSPKGKPFKCQICGDTFSVGCLFIRHIDSHEEVEGSILYQCEVCCSIFEQFLSLFSHRQAMHRSSNYSCAQCQRAFVCGSDLKRHTRLMHYVEKAFVCNFCGKSFSQKYNLVFHQRTHTGEQPYSCEYCNKRFARPGNLNIHLRTHTTLKPKMHRCSTCDKPFKTRQQLKFHAQLMHNYDDDYHNRNGGGGDMLFKCDICGDGYSNCKDLKEHVQLHQSGDRQTYMCNSCGKQFLHSYMLLQHKQKRRLCQAVKVQRPRTTLQP